MIALLIAGGSAFGLALFGTKYLIVLLTKRGIGQEIRDDAPVAHPHVAKRGTPTMGGITLVVGAFLGYTLAHIRNDVVKFSDQGLVLLLLIGGLGLVGFLDDYLGVRRKRNLGLRKRGKTAGLLAVTTVFVWLAHSSLHLPTTISVTSGTGLDVPAWVWILFTIDLVYGTANAVNLTDGLDGLAAGSSAVVFGAFMLMAFVQFRHPEQYDTLLAASLDTAAIAAALLGGCLGFLWWNAAPARVFMGDTGSLALGGAIAGFAVVTNTVLLLPIIGALFVIETLSVLIQIISFRVFKKRMFRMAPIHHHFELKGWPETTVIVRFWLLSGISTAIGLGIFYARFIDLAGVRLR